MEKIFNEILGLSSDAVILVVAVLLTRALLYKAPKYFYKILWGLVGLRLCIPFTFTSAFSLVPEKVPVAVDRVASQIEAVPVEQGLSFMDVVSVLWFGVGVLLFSYGVFSYIKLKLKILDSVLLEDNVYQSERIESPFVCGFIKPKIYLPYGLDDKTRECVLQHEKTHIKHGDHILKYIGFAVLCVHWFNPLVWVSYFLLCKDIELSCDESVIKHYDADACRHYAKALLELGVNKVKLSACPVAFGEVSIKKRIKSVINYKKASRILVVASLCVCVGVSVCFMTEPEVTLKEKVDNVEANEPYNALEETTELVTESVSEDVTELTTEATTELFVEETQVDIVHDEAPVYDEEFKELIEINKDEVYEEMVLAAQREFFKYDPYYNTPTTTDPMYNQARDAGVLVDDGEKADMLGNIGYNIN